MQVCRPAIEPQIRFKFRIKLHEDRFSWTPLYSQVLVYQLISLTRWSISGINGVFVCLLRFGINASLHKALKLGHTRQQIDEDYSVCTTGVYTKIVKGIF